jgi:hypothetical protein
VRTLGLSVAVAVALGSVLACGAKAVDTAPLSPAPPASTAAAPPKSAAQGATLAASGLGTCARFGRSACCWGGSPYATPTRIPLPGTPTDIAVMGNSGCAIVAREVWCWARDKAAPERLAGVDRPVRLSAAGLHACALKDDRTVTCWGKSTFGEVGNGRAEDAPQPPADVGLSDVVELAAGEWHQCARKGNGTLSCWGMGFGDADCSHSRCSRVPVDVPLPGPAAAVSAGGTETCVRVEGGATYCWRLEAGKPPTPVEDAKLAGPSALRLGYGLSCALPSDHRPICWGHLGHKEHVVVADHVAIAGLERVVEYASGWYHACVRTEDGDVRCLGANDGHQLGDGTTTDSAEPRPPVRCDD